MLILHIIYHLKYVSATMEICFYDQLENVFQMKDDSSLLSPIEYRFEFAWYAVNRLLILIVVSLIAPKICFVFCGWVLLRLLECLKNHGDLPTFWNL